MPRDAGVLARIHRVRTIQLNLAHAEEVRAREQVASDAGLHARIAALGAAVAPQTATLAGVALGAAAHYRERLHQSAATAATRVEQAEARLARATEATRAARQDQGAVDKLIARARIAATAREMRALEEAPPARGNRHDPC